MQFSVPKSSLRNLELKSLFSILDQQNHSYLMSNFICKPNFKIRNCRKNDKRTRSPNFKAIFYLFWCLFNRKIRIRWKLFCCFIIFGEYRRFFQFFWLGLRTCGSNRTRYIKKTNDDQLKDLLAAWEKKLILLSLVRDFLGGFHDLSFVAVFT